MTTWHNDNDRTGQQLSESTLTPTSVTQTAFGLLWQYTVAGQVYAQPLAVTVPNCTQQPCNLVIVATERDKLYAFDATSNTQVWSADLAANAGGVYVNCASFLPPCHVGIIQPDLGVTGTPVVDLNAGTIYVVSAVQVDFYPNDIQYYLHAIDLRTGNEKANSPYVIIASVTGATTFPASCGNTTTSGTLSLDPRHHLQRGGLLLLNGMVYIPFAPVLGETDNGWILGYSYSTNSGFTQVAVFNTTPFGTGGGIWGSAAGLAAATNSDGKTYMFTATGNGTFDANSSSAPNTDYGDSFLRLAVSGSGALSVADSFTPSDQATRCANDIDLGSGGIMALPDSFFTGHADLMVGADKESKLFVADRDNLGGYHTSDSVLQEITTPSGSNQGYYSNPAYWKWTDGQGTHRAIYYSVRPLDGTGNPPFPMNMYILNPTTGPIPTSPTNSTGTLYCGYGTTPSVSANSTAGGIVWAIEATNTDNTGQPLPDCAGTYGAAALHAYSATNLSALYKSNGLSTNTGYPVKFSTPTIFNGRVYLGTRGTNPNDGSQVLVDVFGLCNSQTGGCLN